MAYHIPFAHRRRGCPVYIGFDESMVVMQPPRPRRWNGWSLASFLTLLLSVGLLAPLAFLMGLLGLRKSPRTLATFSTLTSGVITAAMVLGIVAIARDHQDRKTRFEHARFIARQSENIKVTHGLIARAEDKLLDYQLENNGQLPAEYDGMLLTVEHQDAWKNPLRYEIGEGSYYIRSAGPDQKYETRDDIRHRIGSRLTSSEGFYD